MGRRVPARCAFAALNFSPGAAWATLTPRKGKGCQPRWPLVAVVALILLAPAAASAMALCFSYPTVQPALVTPNMGTNGDGSVKVGAGASVTVECDAGYSANIDTVSVSFDGGAYTPMSCTGCGTASSVTGT